MFAPKQVTFVGVTVGVPVKFKKYNFTVLVAAGQVPLPVVVSVSVTKPVAISAAVGV